MSDADHVNDLRAMTLGEKIVTHVHPNEPAVRQLAVLQDYLAGQKHTFRCKLRDILAGRRGSPCSCKLNAARFAVSVEGEPQ